MVLARQYQYKEESVSLSAKCEEKILPALLKSYSGEKIALTLTSFGQGGLPWGSLKEKTLQCFALFGVLFSYAHGSMLPAFLKSYSGEKIALTLTSFGQGGLPWGDLKEKTLQCFALFGVLFSYAHGSMLPALLKIKPRCLRTRVFSFVGVRRF